MKIKTLTTGLALIASVLFAQQLPNVPKMPLTADEVTSMLAIAANSTNTNRIAIWAVRMTLDGRTNAARQMKAYLTAPADKLLFTNLLANAASNRASYAQAQVDKQANAAAKQAKAYQQQKKQAALALVMNAKLSMATNNPQPLLDLMTNKLLAYPIAVFFIGNAIDGRTNVTGEDMNYFANRTDSNAQFCIQVASNAVMSGVITEKGAVTAANVYRLLRRSPLMPSDTLKGMAAYSLTNFNHRLAESSQNVLAMMLSDAQSVTNITAASLWPSNQLAVTVDYNVAAATLRRPSPDSGWGTQLRSATNQAQALNVLSNYNADLAAKKSAAAARFRAKSSVTQ